MARLVAAGVRLRDQVNKAFPNRDKRSDGWIGDRAHQARKSDHNPDAKGFVHALDIDADLIPGAPKRSKQAAQALADQLVAYAKSGAPGADRIKYVVYNRPYCVRHILENVLGMARIRLRPHPPHPRFVYR